MNIRTIARSVSALVLAAGLAQAAQAAWIPAKAVVAQAMLERAFATSMANHVPVRSAIAPDAVPVARIAVPRLGAEAVVLSGQARSALSLAPTELATRVNGVRVFAGHRDTHFAFIRDLAVGDEVTLTDAAGLHRYTVTRFETVRHDRFAVPRNAGAAMIALATCYPFDAPIGTGPRTPWRRVAWAEAVAD